MEINMCANLKMKFEIINMKKLGISLLLFVCIVTSGFAIEKNPSWTKEVGAKQEPTGKGVVSANSLGAIGDSITLNSKAIQAAIDACAAKGGGVVTFKPGRYLSGSIFLKKGVQFRLDAGVTILGSQNIADYPIIRTRIAGIEMNWPAALVNVIDQENVAISGKGTIDGQGKFFWDLYWSMRKTYDPKGLRWIVDYDCQRPRTLLVQNSKNVTIENIQLQRAGFWTVQLLYSENCTVNGVTVRNNIGGHGPSTDGIDIDSSKRILVENCDIDCNDDNICLKAGRDADGQRVNRSTEYVVVHDCVSARGGGLVVFGSETAGSIRHVVAYNLKTSGTSAAVRFKSAINRGGTVEDVSVYNVTVSKAKQALVVSLNWNPAYSYSKLPTEYEGKTLPEHWTKMLEVVPLEKGLPTFRDIHISDVVVTDTPEGINAIGMEKSMLNNFSLDNCVFNVEKAGEINYGKNWTLKNVLFNTPDKSGLKITNDVNVKVIK